MLIEQLVALLQLFFSRLTDTLFRSTLEEAIFLSILPNSFKCYPRA